MGRPGQNANDKLDARIAALRRAVLQAERALARETKNREIPCQCQDGCQDGRLDGGYIYTQADFEEMRGIFETERAEWLAEHKMKTAHKMKTQSVSMTETVDV